MQALKLRKRTGCLESDRKVWERSGILIPLVNGGGAGVHAQYDEANLIAVALAMQLKNFHVVVSKYGPAFRDLHEWLRCTSSLQWSQYRVFLTPEGASFCKHKEPLPRGTSGYVNDLEPLTIAVFGDDNGKSRDLPFGLEIVSK